MSNIKIHVFHCGKVCVAPDIPFGGEKTNIIKASGLLTPKKQTIMATSISISYRIWKL